MWGKHMNSTSFSPPPVGQARGQRCGMRPQAGWGTGVAVHATPKPIVCDESPTGYSLASCSPAALASASPAGNDHGARLILKATELQSMAMCRFFACLTLGDHPMPCRHSWRHIGVLEREGCVERSLDAARTRAYATATGIPFAVFMIVCAPQAHAHSSRRLLPLNTVSAREPTRHARVRTPQV